MESKPTKKNHKWHTIFKEKHLAVQNSFRLFLQQGVMPYIDQWEKGDIVTDAFYEHMNEMYKALNKNSNFCEADWKLHEFDIDVIKVGAKHRLQKAGQSGDTHYFIIKGLVRLFYVTPQGKEYNRCFYDEGSIVGSLTSVILDEPCRFSIETLEPCVLVRLPLNEIYTPERQANGWDQLFNHSCQLMLMHTERREADLLTMTAKDRFLQFVETFPGYMQRIPQYHIASYLGITPVALSKYKKQWLNESSGS
jgi:CRP-like cAMP-binding protein